MIKERLIEIGQFNKPHGINGEISATLDVDPSELSCIVVEMDGIDVPFYLTSVRPKRGDTMLLKIEGYNSEQEVRPFVNKYIYALSTEIEEEGDDSLNDDGEGFYAADFIGFSAVDADGTLLGKIVDIDDNTENVLFVIERPEPGTKPLLVPVADEFIAAVDTAAPSVTFNLPTGLLDL